MLKFFKDKSVKLVKKPDFVRYPIEKQQCILTLLREIVAYTRVSSRINNHFRILVAAGRWPFFHFNITLQCNFIGSPVTLIYRCCKYFPPEVVEIEFKKGWEFTFL